MATQFEETEYKFPDEQKEEPKAQEEEAGIEVVIEDDTPEEDRNKQPLPQNLKDELENDGLEIENYDKEVKKKLKQMKKVWHDERREKEAALREQQAALAYAQRLRSENQRMRNILQIGEKQFVESITTTADLQLKLAEQEYKDAYESGDSDRILAANKALQQAGMQVMQVKNFKAPALQEESFEVQPETVRQQQPAQVEPDQKAVEWQKRNPWFGKKQSMTAYAYGLHAEFEQTGMEIGSDKYYRELDKAIRKRFPEEFEDSQEAKPKQEGKKKGLNVVAPATRSTASNKVKLTMSELNLAKKFNLTPEQFALEKLKLERTNG